MATPGYDGQAIGRDCRCEDFPCCGHGLTRADYEDNRYYDFDDEDREEPAPDYDTRWQDGMEDDEY